MESKNEKFSNTNPLEVDLKKTKEGLLQLSLDIQEAQQADEDTDDAHYPNSRPLMLQWIKDFEDEYLPTLYASREPNDPTDFDVYQTPLSHMYAFYLRLLLKHELPKPRQSVFKKAAALIQRNSN